MHRLDGRRNLYNVRPQCALLDPLLLRLVTQVVARMMAAIVDRLLVRWNRKGLGLHVCFIQRFRVRVIGIGDNEGWKQNPSISLDTSTKTNSQLSLKERVVKASRTHTMLGW